MRAWRRAFGSSCGCPRPRRPISTIWPSAATAGRPIEEVYGGGFRQPAPFRAEDSVTAFLADRFLGWLDGQGPRAVVRPCRVPQAAPALRGAGALVLVGRAGRRAGAGPRAPTVGGRGCHASVARGAPGACRSPAPTGAALLDGASLARLRAVYFGLVAEVDHHLGRILEALARRGELDRTLVIVTSDHGEMLGDHWMLGKAGLLSAGVPRAAADPPPGRRARPPRDGVHRACRSDADRTGQPRAARPASMRWTSPVGFSYRPT